MSDARYLEDIHPGESFESGRFTVVESEMIEFARRFDPQPMHTDPAAALQGPFGGLIASGWYTAAEVMRLVNDARPLGSTPIIGIGVDRVKWLVPVRPGDTLRARVEVLEVIPSRNHPSHGVVKLRVTTRNQRDEVVMALEPNCWMPRRPAR